MDRAHDSTLSSPYCLIAKGIVPTKRREEYKAKVTNDGDLMRGRVPCPLLHELKARPGDYLTFRLDDSGKVVVLLSRTRRKPGKKRR